MDSTSGAQRVDYGNKTGENGKSKVMSSKSLDMTKGGGSGDGSGPTGSSRSYPKSSKSNFSPDFNPMTDKKRGATDWVVGGV
jgi:hypothetical protein